MFANTISFIKGISLKFIRKLGKLVLNVPFEPNKSIFKLIRLDKEKINLIEIAGIHRIDYTDETGKEGAYTGQTKNKIIERAREYWSDLKHERMNTALAKLNRRVSLKVDFKNPVKLEKLQ